MSTRLFEFSFVSIVPSTWNRKLSNNEIEEIIGTAILINSELLGRTLGFYKPPRRIRELKITAAAFDQIAYSWWGKRKSSSASPPAIPLKYYVYGFGQKQLDTWVDIEVLPGLDNWYEY